MDSTLTRALFCQGSFAKETYYFGEPTKWSSHISRYGHEQITVEYEQVTSQTTPYNTSSTSTRTCTHMYTLTRTSHAHTTYMLRAVRAVRRVSQRNNNIIMVDHTLNLRSKLVRWKLLLRILPNHTNKSCPRLLQKYICVFVQK